MSDLTLQLTDSVLAGVRDMADRERLSVEDYASRLLAEAVRDDAEWRRLAGHGREVGRERYLQLLAKAGDAEPEATDRADTP